MVWSKGFARAAYPVVRSLIAAVLMGHLPGCLLEDPVPLFDQDRDGVITAADCDDQDPAVGSAYRDEDGDGYGAGDPLAGCGTSSPLFVSVGGDCADQDPSAHPDAPEVCNGVDDDCDGVSDEDFPPVPVYPDGDGDGYGVSAEPSSACGQMDGLVLEGGDCNDQDPGVNPGAKEVCNLVDDDCDGDVDEAWPRHLYAPDGDGDGCGDMSSPVLACTSPGSVYVSGADDCDDTDPAVHPGAPEQCNGLDDDCDRRVDESLDTSVWYLDLDGDGHGSAEGPVSTGCLELEGFSSVGDDCDDADPARYPGAFDTLGDEVDSDCDGQEGEIRLVVGSGGEGEVQSGMPALDLPLEAPEGIALGPDGSLFVADSGASVVLRVDPDGTAWVVAGIPGAFGFSGDGGAGSSALLDGPTGLAVDLEGRLLVCDTFNNRVRRLDQDGMIQTMAGVGTPGSSGDGGDARDAELNQPRGVAVDTDGRIYVADTQNHRVRVIGPDGIIDTLAGSGAPGYGGDGDLAVRASLSFPYGVAVDSGGTVWIADTGNHVVRTVDPVSSVITTVAGIGVPGHVGDGGSALEAALDTPEMVAPGPGGLCYIADSGNSVVRLVSPSGTIDTVVGTGAPGHDGDGGAPEFATLDYPCDLQLAPDGTLFVADILARRVRLVDP